MKVWVVLSALWLHTDSPTAMVSEEGENRSPATISRSCAALLQDAAGGFGLGRGLGFGLGLGLAFGLLALRVLTGRGADVLVGRDEGWVVRRGPGTAELAAGRAGVVGCSPAVLGVVTVAGADAAVEVAAGVGADAARLGDGVLDPPQAASTSNGPAGSSRSRRTRAGCRNPAVPAEEPMLLRPSGR